MAEFTPIDGNPSETVGTTRMVSAEESGDRMRLHLSPRGLSDVLSDHLQSIHVLIALFVGLGAEMLLALIADSMFPRTDLTWVFAGGLIVLLVLCSSLYFAVVHADDPGEIVDPSSITLEIGGDRFDVSTEGWWGRRTVLEGTSWELLQMLQRLDRNRIAPSTRVMASLRPTASLRSLLVAGLTNEDRRWLLRQFEIET